ncbi:uracil-DNA glycosylase [Rhodococcoides kyotonense]|uniref:Type-5 uracil-DNA glycosylase n=1 Tax=Rhodococcoides kyotonense TaxID=398843 RepID=A0A239I5Z7_9NOCA|nr:uracil-DNA glycosylase [Rhodococcus kyotonensis]SNS89306.1 uracil-DNA glycosylase, family 4 [Rhodococcus kyotonensis]
MGSITSIGHLDREVSRCRACPRLVAWREKVAAEKKAEFRDQHYWGRPVPGFGPADAPMLIVGLAPAAHGGNRTGRMFTGDRAGDFLYAALHAVGLSNQPTATHIDDGLALRGVRITAPVHCAPPANKPTTAERDRCGQWLDIELGLLKPKLRSVVVLGGFGWQSLLPVLERGGWEIPRPRPKFGHGTEVDLAESSGRSAGSTPGEIRLFGCFHVSQRNTFTGLLTPTMVEDVLRAAGTHAGLL